MSTVRVTTSARAAAEPATAERRQPPGSRRTLAAVLALCLGATLAAAVPASPAAAVVDGTVVEDLSERWPFIVKVGTETHTTCGGALIHPEWVLTAAHCISSTLSHVHYGSLLESALVAVPVSEVHEHPYSWHITGFDMGLVRLSTPLTSVVPATIATASPEAGDTVWTAGWGAIDANGGTYVDELREGAMTVNDDATAPSGYGPWEETSIWAGGPGQADACYGDSGGPLVDAAGDLVGVVSRAVPWPSQPCGDGGLYTDLTHPAAQTWLASKVPSLFAADDEAPAVVDVTAEPEVVAVGATVTVAATVDDASTGGSSIEGAELTVDGGSAAPMAADDLTFDSPIEAVTATFTPAVAGLFDVCVTGTDVSGNTSDPSCTAVAVYDPDSGFTVGNGTVDSPASADLVSGASGPARFVFVSRYRNGRSTPDGPFHFHLESGDLRFTSTGQSWLVITGEPRARFRGVGVLNGEVQCSYVVDAWDGSHPGAGGDAFGVQLFGCGGSGGSTYDLAAQALTRGDIKIKR